MRHLRTPSLRHLLVCSLIIICNLGGPSLRVMRAADRAGSQSARVPIARLSVPKLRGSSLPPVQEAIARIGVAFEGPRTKRRSAGRGHSSSRFALADARESTQVRAGLWGLGYLPTSHPLRI
jgi:hypothetical protein